MSTRKPDFIIGGAARAGTTWLCRALCLHRGIYMPPSPPEPKFFPHDNIFARGLEYYCETFFSQAPHGACCGEKSTAYLDTPGTAARIHQLCPDVKLIFMLREPVERAFSNFLWTKQNGFEDEYSFERALAIEQVRTATLPESLRLVKPFSYAERSLYADLLRPYFALFPRTSILCLKMEDIHRDPTVLIQKALDFLRITPERIDYSSLGVINAAVGEEKMLPSQEARAWFHHNYPRATQDLTDLLGKDFFPW